MSSLADSFLRDFGAHDDDDDDEHETDNDEEVSHSSPNFISPQNNNGSRTELPTQHNHQSLYYTTATATAAESIDEADAAGAWNALIPSSGTVLFKQQPTSTDAPKNQLSIPDAVQVYIDKLTRPREKMSALFSNPEFEEFIQQLVDSDRERSDLLTIELLDKCNLALQEVDQEILAVYRYIKDMYNRRFPELESIVPAPLNYVLVIQRLKNALDVGQVDLSDALPNSTVMAVTVAASVTIGTPLPPNVLQKVIETADEVDELVEKRNIILRHIERSMAKLAPNLTALAGSSLGARLVTHAGSLEQLAKMPSQNILLLGGSSFARTTTAFTTGSTQSALPAAARNSGVGYGVIWHSDIVQGSPPAYRIRAMKLLAGKCGLAVRKDCFSHDGSDNVGKMFREQILRALKKQQEPPPSRLVKPLQIPDERPRAKRGGKRRRRQREKYGVTELRQKANRLNFSIDVQQEPLQGLDDQSD